MHEHFFTNGKKCVWQNYPVIRTLVTHSGSRNRPTSSHLVPPASSFSEEKVSDVPPGSNALFPHVSQKVRLVLIT